jgi:DNA-binding winged helix-turn-helix (wHTH) protein/pimeloyl-ACP methyl ester carboxylesterase
MVMLLDGCVELDDELFELRRAGVVVPLEPQAFDVLRHLVDHRDRVVSKEELMDAVWRDRFVSDTAVTSRIKQIRRALSDDGQQQRVIRTVHRRGYRFVAEVRSLEDVHNQLVEPTGRSTTRAPIRYTVSDGLHIAYQVSGGGDRDIVLISGFMSHLDIDWEDPRHAHFLERLGSMGRLIRFDKRGTGMSDRPSGLPDLETRMHDVLAVMDAVGSERAVVCGYSEGGPMAVLLAAMHPSRVAALVLYGCYAKRTRGDDNPWAPTDDERRAYTDWLVTSWDWRADLLARCPSGDAAMQDWWARRMSAAATPGTVRALMDMNSLVDVRPLLRSVQAPTLVLHRVGDRIVPAQEARYLGEHLPHTTLRLVPGADHLVCGDPDQLLDEVELFLAELPDRHHHHALAAIACASGPGAADVVDDLVAAGGRARRAPRALGSHAVVPLVVFDGPATAVRAGRVALLRSPAASIGVTIAELPLAGEVAFGPGVEQASRLSEDATAGSVVVSGPVATLLAGTGVHVDPGAEGDGHRVRP